MQRRAVYLQCSAKSISRSSQTINRLSFVSSIDLQVAAEKGRNVEVLAVHDSRLAFLELTPGDGLKLQRLLALLAPLGGSGSGRLRLSGRR